MGQTGSKKKAWFIIFQHRSVYFNNDLSMAFTWVFSWFNPFQPALSIIFHPLHLLSTPGAQFAGLGTLKLVGFLATVKTWYPALLTYAVGFFAAPAWRFFGLGKQNAEIQKRNRNRCWMLNIRRFIYIYIFIINIK